MRLWLCLYGCQQQHLDDKPWQLIIHHCLSLTGTTSLRHQASWVPNSDSPILQVTAISPKACGFHHTLIYLFTRPLLCLCQWIQVPPPWSLCPSHLLPHVTNSSAATHLFLTLQAKFTASLCYSINPLTFFYSTQMLSLMSRTSVYINIVCHCPEHANRL